MIPPAGPIVCAFGLTPFVVAPAPGWNGRAPGVPFFTRILRSAKQVACPGFAALHSGFPIAYSVVAADAAEAPTSAAASAAHVSATILRPLTFLMSDPSVSLGRRPPLRLRPVIGGRRATICRGRDAI